MDGVFPGLGSEPFQAPHCDELVLHAPGECEFCDHYPNRQAARVRDLINFTGHHEPHKELCPSEVRRPLATLEQWGGNVAAKGNTLFPHSEPPRVLLWDMYGDRAEPAHPEPAPRELLEAVIARIPKGAEYRGTRYDTDSEMVLSVWADGETYDLRVARSTPGIPFPEPFLEQTPLIHLFGYAIFTAWYRATHRLRERWRFRDL